MIDYDSPHLNDQIMQVDSCYWAMQNKISLLGGIPFTTEGYGYQAEIMRDPATEKAVMKSAQSGITTLFMLDAIHGLIYGEYPQGVIYYFPTEKAVEGFSKTRFGPLVDDNPVIKKYLKNTNSVSVKKVGNTFLSLLGAKATQSIQGKKDGTSVRSTPADYVIRDERDLFDESMVRMSKDRLQNSKIAREVDLGTPTIPDFGISKQYEDSDQRRWMIRCKSCGEWTCIVDNFPDSIRFREDEPYFACKCGAEINPRDGEWVAKYPDRSMAGWHVSYFITPNCNLKKAMARWEKDSREGKIGEFYNGVLGLPYIPAEDRLRQSDVFACCGNDLMASLSLKETAMGADIGKRANHVVIAEKIDSKRARIIYIARVKGFDALHDLAKKYNVKSAVIDMRPYEESFRKFQESESYRVFGAQYFDKQKKFLKTDEKSGVYSILRTQIFDRTHAMVVNKDLEIPRRCSEVDEFARQMCNCAKVLEEDEETGDRRYKYIKLGDEHYRNAVNYLSLALEDLTHYQGMGTVGYKEPQKEWDPLTIGLK